MVTLRLLTPGGSLYACPVSDFGSDGLFSIPLTQSVTTNRAGRVQVLEVAEGTHIDTLGMDSPVFQVEMTSGTKPKEHNGIMYPPDKLLTDLEAFVQFYFDDRQEAIKSGRELIEMAFDDELHSRHWIVTPAGAPQHRKNAREPLRGYLSFVLHGVRPTRTPSRHADHVGQLQDPADKDQLAGILENYMMGSIA